MRLRKIVIVMAIATTISSVATTAFATIKNNESNSIVINKSNITGDRAILKDKDLENVNPYVKHGSIKIALSDTKDKSSKEGVHFSISKVADIVDGRYVMLDRYSSLKVDLNSLKNSNDLDIAANILKKVAKADRTVVTDNNGECSIDNLNIGVYLIYASDISKYENITPFLVSIPTFNNIDKTMSYDIKIIPKHTPLPIEETITRKAPSTGFNGGEVFGVVSLVSLVGAGILFVAKRKE